MSGIRKSSLSLVVCIAIITSVSAIALSLPGSEGQRQQKIFIAFSYPLGQWSDGIISGLTERLSRASIQFDIKQTIFDSPRLALLPEAETKNEIERLVKSASNYKPDFIILCDDEGADLLAPHMKKLGIPLLFAGINKEEKDIPWLEKGAEMTGVFERYPISPSLKLLFNLTKGKAQRLYSDAARRG